MRQYLNLVQQIRDEGIPLSADGERTGTGTLSIYGAMMKFDLADGFPLVTAKKTFFKGVKEELLWFLRGETNSRTLEEKGVNIWREWAHPATGDLGPVYGKMWRGWPTTVECNDPYSDQDFYLSSLDQLERLLCELETDPHSRRHIVTAWNPDLLPHPRRSHQENVEKGRQVLPPCHTLWQVSVCGAGRVHLHLYQRSADVFLGVPFNIASYSLLLLMIAKKLGREAGTFIWTGHDCHLYANHTEQVDQLLQRSPLPLPTVSLNYKANAYLWDVNAEDIELVNYQSYSTIKAPVAV